MIIETGTVVFLSLIVLFWRLSPARKRWFIDHPAWLEVPFGIIAYMLHYGTFSGMMAAAVASIMVYGFMQLMRVAYGYNDPKRGFVKGWL